MNKTLTSVILSMALIALVPANDAVADALQNIQAKGTIVVGGKTDYKPFGYRESDGSVVGLSVDLAEMLAKELNVEVELVATSAANQLEFLTQGRVDILIAAMNATPERREVVNIIDPGYAASGATLLSAKPANIQNWEDIKGKRVCAVQGAYYNRPVQETYEAEVVAFRTTPEAYAALKGGNCVALVYDDNSISQMIQTPEWENFEMPVASILEQPTVMAVSKGNDAMRDRVQEIMVEWYKAGVIAELEKKWLGRNSAYVLDNTEKAERGELD